MLFSDMAESIAQADRSALDAVSRALWAGHAAGHFTDQDATALAEAIEARRKPADGHETRPAPFRRHATQRPPERCVAMERRRRLATSGVMPPALAARFTMGELAVLRIVADEQFARGACKAPVDAIAARAGVSRSTAKNAIREARRLGMVEVKERPQYRAKHLPSIVTVIDREWLAWMRRGKGIGVKNLTATDTNLYRRGEGRVGQPHARDTEIRISAFMEPAGKCSLSRTRPREGLRGTHGARD